MQTPRGHASVARIFAATGVHLPEPSPSAPPPTTSRLGRSKSSVSLSKAAAAGRRRETGTGIPRAASSLHLGASSSASAAFKHQHERAHTDGGRPPVPRSASTPAAVGMFSRGGNVFTRFAGPRGGRAQTHKVDAADAAEPKDDTTATKPKDNTTATRERAQMPRSASTPPAPSGRRIGGEHHGWAHVGVIWEALGERGADGEKHEHDAREGRVREPAMKATLSASSSRPWALARAGSTGSLVDASDCEEQEQVAKAPSGSNSGSSSSCSVNISFVSPVRRTGSETTTASSSSEPVSESEVSYPPHPYPSYTYKVGKHIYDAAEVYTDPSEEADGDDERSGSDEEDIRFAFPKRRSVAYSRTYRDVGELGVDLDGDGEVSECGAETGHHPPHGRARSEQGYVGAGTPLVRAGARKYATHAGYPSLRSRATHGHGGAETDPEEEYDDYGNVYGEGYEGDGYGGAPGEGEDAWMRARARSLARLRARKEVRRGGGV
ncbi:hypothetical protein B0H16DRAFT_969504 [Mycena metata]|uniref:Uncharacterized protein n=1 Tax=Mycena metata TaxID=1033252 RepID=A0AAD7INP1_9AGAR|nr:hypothetical protein B0H16DRAFT_969504 [Mycena metata]